VRSRFEAPAHDRVALAARRPFDEMTKGVVEPVVPAFVAAREGLRLDRIEVAPPETTFPLSLRSPVYAATAALTLPSPKGRGFKNGAQPNPAQNAAWVRRARAWKCWPTEIRPVASRRFTVSK
jgi:hypothetical protein